MLSASADQPLKAVNKAFDDKALLEARRLNQEDPTSLRQIVPLMRSPWRRNNCALLLTGELRCLSRSAALLRRLSKAADLFVVTTAEYAEAAEGLTHSSQTLIVDQLPSSATRSLSVGSINFT